MAVFTSNIWAFIFPNSTDLGMQTEISDGRNIYCLMPEYLTVDTSGAFVQKAATDPSYTYMGYSTANAALIKQKSSHQYVTVSCNNWTTKGDVLCSDSTKRAAAITTLISMLDTIKFDGAIYDFEPFGNTTLTLAQYNNYKTFLQESAVALHNAGYKLGVCGPSVNDVDSPFLASLYRYKYADMNNLALDLIFNMSYDSQYNYTISSTNSVAPNSFLQTICDYMKSQIYDQSKILAGVPTYGYHGTDGASGGGAVLDTATQSATRTGYGTATTNADYEKTWVNGGVRSFYQDASGISSKRDLVEAKGIKNIFAWVLGGNPWFSGKTEPPVRALAGSRTANSPSASSSRTAATNRKLI